MLFICAQRREANAVRVMQIASANSMPSRQGPAATLQERIAIVRRLVSTTFATCDEGQQRCIEWQVLQILAPLLSPQGASCGIKDILKLVCQAKIEIDHLDQTRNLQTPSNLTTLQSPLLAPGPMQLRPIKATEQIPCMVGGFDGNPCVCKPVPRRFGRPLD